MIPVRYDYEFMILGHMNVKHMSQTYDVTVIEVSACQTYDVTTH